MSSLRLLNAKDIAERLGVGRTRAYQLMRSGEMPVVRIGRSVRVREVALQQWILDHEEDAEAGYSARWPR